MSKIDFVEGIDYYLLDGMIIMTESYHIKRGQCCGSKCKHCAFEPIYEKGSKIIKKKDLDI